MSSPLIHIDRWRCENSGGVVRVKLVVPDDVLSYASASEEAGVELKPGKEVYHIEVDPRTAGHRETLSLNDQGDYYPRSLRFEIRRMRQSVQTLKRRVRNRRVHAIFTDENGLTNLYLNMRLRTADSRNEYRSKNNNELELVGAGKFPAPYVIGELLPEPGGPGPGGPGAGGGGLEVGPPPDDDPGAGSGGGAEDDDLGGGGTVPGEGGDGGGGGTPPSGDDPVFLQPTTGDFYRITIGPCEEIITTKIDG